MPNLLMHSVTDTLILTTPFLTVLALVCYVASALLIFRSINEQAESSKYLNIALPIVCTGSVAHFFIALNYSQLLSPTGMNFGLDSMTLLISAILSVIFVLGCLLMPILRLGLLVLPLLVLSIVFSHFWQSTPHFSNNTSLAMTIHILIAVVAYSLIAIATIQAVLYAYQDHHIKKRKEPSLLLALPPLQTMEALFFRLLGIGFICLTATLIGGVVISQKLFSHHILLAALAWCVFAYVLFQHYRNGMRGSKAVNLTIAGFVLIQLGYFGTKIIMESL